MLLVATVVTTVAVLGTDVARRPASPLAVVFPLLVAASVALLVLRGLERAGVRRWVRARVGSPRWLAGQRARTTAGDAAAITLSLAVGLAVLGYALAVHRGVTEGIDDKVAAQVGARTVVELADELAGPANRRPQQAVSPVHGGTVVYRGQATSPARVRQPSRPRGGQPDVRRRRRLGRQRRPEPRPRRARGPAGPPGCSPRDPRGRHRPPGR